MDSMSGNWCPRGVHLRISDCAGLRRTATSALSVMVLGVGSRAGSGLRHCSWRGQHPARPRGGRARRRTLPPEGMAPGSHCEPHASSPLCAGTPPSLRAHSILPPLTREVFLMETSLNRAWCAPQPCAPTFCCPGVHLQWVGGQHGSLSPSPSDGHGASRTAQSSCSQAFLPQPRELALPVPCRPGTQPEGQARPAALGLRSRAPVHWPAGRCAPQRARARTRDGWRRSVASHPYSVCCGPFVGSALSEKESAGY